MFKTSRIVGSIATTALTAGWDSQATRRRTRHRIIL